MLGMRARERGDSMTCCHHTWIEVRWAGPSRTLAAAGCFWLLWQTRLPMAPW